MVTNHESLGYLAHAYDLDVLGTVLPAASTMAEPSASDLAALIEEMNAHSLCTIFSETTISDKLAQAVAAELTGCDQVSVRPVYTGAIGPAGSGADSYIGMFRHNVDTIVAGLQ
jgi:ABC-type Zn uptake system ZnuABC Zn-binding protein ZnuA